MKKLLHKLYKFCGHILCRVFLLYWKTRDALFPPKTDSILFVAHPDDDTLFFHTFIKEKKPYVVLMTTGWSLRRMPCFFRVMKKYGVRYRAYDLEARDQRMALLKKHVDEMKKVKNFALCATHNAEGEYGHKMHQRVHQAVLSQMDCPVLCPAGKDTLHQYPLPKSIAQEKNDIFNQIYTTEKFVLDQYGDWVIHEHLEEIEHEF